MSEIAVHNIHKSYDKGKTIALDNVTLEVNKGELFGLIGPDGAGKTTLMRILTTLILPDKGTATVNGFDCITDFTEIRKNVGYMPGKFSLYQDLSVEENLTFFATIFKTTIAENYDLIKDIYQQIEPFKTRRAGQLSGGMKQKLALCCALIHRPKVLFLDEPTTGVDAVSRKEFWGMLGKLKQEGITIFVSTPYMDEATLCERIALIQEGKILSINSPQKTIEAFPKDLYSAQSENMPKLLHHLRESKLIESCNSFGNEHHFTFHNEEQLAQLKSELTAKSHSEISLLKITPTVEDCFIQLMQK